MNRFEDFNANFVPNEPQPDHPSFEERWLEDEAAAKKKSRLLSPRELQEAYNNAPEGLGTVEVSLATQDVKTAKRLNDGWERAFEKALDEKDAQCQAKIEALIEEIENLIIGVEGCEFEERLIGDKGCLVLDMNQNQWDDFKAKYTSKGDEG